MSRRNIWIPPTVWKKVVRKAGQATVSEGRTVSAAEIIRRAIEAYLTKASNREGES